MKRENLSDWILPFKECDPIPTLYIIGNGFDVAHGIKSKYIDFCNFEKKKNNKRFVDLMDIFLAIKQIFGVI